MSFWRRAGLCYPVEKQESGGLIGSQYAGFVPESVAV